MKIERWFLLILAAGALLCAEACKRKEQPSEWTTVGSVRIAMPELQQSLQNNATAELQRCLSDASLALRYGQYDKVVAALERLASQPGLTPQQQKLATDVIGQVKQLALKSRPK